MLNLNSLNQRVNALTAKVNNIVPSVPETLSQVLTNGNDAGGLDITNLNDLGVTTINGSAYPPASVDITDTNTAGTYYPTFVDSAGSGKILRADIGTTPFSFNPNTGEINLSNTLKITANSLALGKASGTIQSNNCVAVGVNAGASQANNAIAVGGNAGTIQLGGAIAIGAGAGSNQKGSAIAIGVDAGDGNQGDSAISLGNGAGNTNQGDSAIAIGNGAGSSAQGSNSIAIGSGAGSSAQDGQSIAIGLNVGSAGQGTNCVAIGTGSANLTAQPNNTIILNASGLALNPISSSGTFINPIRGDNTPANICFYNTTTKEVTQGTPAPATELDITDTNTSATYYPTFVDGSGTGKILRADIGTTPFSINPNTGDFNLADTLTITQSQLALGKGAGATQGIGSIAVGVNSGLTQSTNAVAIGNGSQQFGGGAGGSVAIGTNSGQTQLGNSVAIGTNAGLTQASNAIAIGNGAQKIGGGAGGSVAIGFQAGETQLANSVAVGVNAGKNQFANAVAIGNGSQSISGGDSSVAIGANSGKTQGANSVAVGVNAGTNQSSSAVAIGINTQVTNGSVGAVAIGTNAGNSNQGQYAVAIGASAGKGTTTGQGNNSIAIGNSAGQLSQTANSICLNASGSALNPNQAGFFVNPIRVDTTKFNQLQYDTATKEMVSFPAVISPITTSGLDITGNTNLLSGTSGPTSGLHLVVVINGVPYKIKLENV